ncbi:MULTISPECIES: stage V sporulation protein AC [Bacillaceae]|uniref:stage V sporulation protein AC n=1 Tax=Bacillaceae TaxID=186817 RepID=UPI001E39B970|nr:MULTISPECIES: stage V sporulation protein AC [Bacillaceae]MCE4050500.1 stage V sporulation protein AC [Bacillus sp. Au-Bac7]MCM3030521.1 stage V sporulation protein AC [Niallia sp. MER 6]MDL0434555.1 stage V sporulation protein AC [Niallia sp. SS-2023]UPO88477.1 stage V sporulation protein AC [Niallia sp. Man26]
MAKKKKTPQQKQYEQLEKKYETKRPVVKNCIKAFFVGGFICMLGQLLSFMYIYFFHFTEQTSGNPTSATIIFLSMLLTGFGIYDRLGQFAGAGSAVPVSGFGNSIISAAIEHRTEGFVLGVGGNIFKLAGSVILFGVFAAFVVALIKTLILMARGVM